METLPPAYKSVGERRCREISGLYYEDFKPGDVFEHRPGWWRRLLEWRVMVYTCLLRQ